MTILLCGFPAAESCPMSPACELHRLRTAARLALDHVLELEDAWVRGTIVERDHLHRGVERSNRNVDVRVALSSALSVRAGLGNTCPRCGQWFVLERNLRMHQKRRDLCDRHLALSGMAEETAGDA